MPFRAVFCDTGHEHEHTLNYVRALPKLTGGPTIEIIKADFSEKFEQKRQVILNKWFRDGVSASHMEQALKLLMPTGIPMLDLCMLKGRFPSAKARFCTEELKSLPMIRQVLFPALKNGSVVNWQGVRAQESRARAKLPSVEWHDTGAIIWRPILRWDHEKVFEFHRSFGIEPNPLYKLGMGRVGCMPCIMCQKSEVLNIAQRFPEHIDRLREWEALVGMVSKRGQSSFFAGDVAPFPPGYDPKVSGYYGIDQVVEWSKTTHGGRQFDLFASSEPPVCSSKYGLCE